MAAQNQIILITGGNAGLGFEAVKALYQSDKSYQIIVGTRTVANGENAVAQLKKETPQSTSQLSVVQVDLESDESIQKAGQEITSGFGRLDVLINNGGASFDRDLEAGKLGLREAWNKSWNVNVAGTMVLTNELLPLLLKSSDPRLMFLTSGTATLAETERFDNPIFQRINASPDAGWPKDNSLNPLTMYRSSKTGLNMAMREYTRLLKNDGVKVWAISPGFLATGLAGIGPEKLKQIGALDPSIGGEFIKDVVQGQYDDKTGKAIRKDMIQPW